MTVQIENIAQQLEQSSSASPQHSCPKPQYPRFRLRVLFTLCIMLASLLGATCGAVAVLSPKFHGAVLALWKPVRIHESFANLLPQLAETVEVPSRRDVTLQSQGLEDIKNSVDQLADLPEPIAGLRAQLNALHSRNSEREQETVLILQLQDTIRRIDANVSKLDEGLKRATLAQLDADSKINKLLDNAKRPERRAPTPAVVPDSVSTTQRNLSRGNLALAAAGTPSIAHTEASRGNQTEAAEGYTLKRVANGVALIQDRVGLLEVAVGDTIPGLGTIRSISQQQDGRWIVTTPRGIITSGNAR